MLLLALVLALLLLLQLPCRTLTRRSALLVDCRRVGDMGEQGERHFCGDSGGCSGSICMA